MRGASAANVYTPLCPAGHLPHKGGDRPDASLSATSWSQMKKPADSRML
ncbi:hypothetical protein AB395_00006413 (plasmid) [Sinorhizobium fredii CCBAU 45436]|nr:hypothetical protein AB395_00006413 [Sinorhizobium fredii CCBAU 45436]